MNRYGRRGFLAAAGAATSSVWTAGAAAMEPIERSGQTPIRLSLAGYSMRQYLSASPGSRGAIDLLGFADFAARLELDAIEPTSYYYPADNLTEFTYRLKRRCHLLGLDISGGAIKNNFTLAPGPDLDRWFDHVQRWIDLYAELGAPVIRVFGGTPPAGVARDQAVENCVRNLERACEMAGKRGLMLALENHDFLSTVEPMLAIVRAVQSPWFGVNWDSGNFHADDPYAELEKIAPYAINAQIKVQIRRRGRPREPADLARLLNILQAAGYRGYLVLEYEAEEDPYDAIPKCVERLRRLLAAK